MNEGQFLALMEQLREINRQLAQLLARPGIVLVNGDARPDELIAALESLRHAPAAMPAEDLPAHAYGGSTTAPRKFKKAKGGG